jgi:hypothetical protein
MSFCGGHRGLRWLTLGLCIFIGNNLGDENEVHADRWLMHNVLADVPLEETLLSKFGLLQSGYRLRVMPEVPPKPADFMSSIESDDVRDDKGEQIGCPLDVRAIVRGTDDSFAVVVTPESRKIIRRGDRVSTTWGYARVVSITEHTVSLRHRGVPVNCPFSF